MTDGSRATQVPTCPWCGLHDRASFIDSPDGRYLCACGSLFDGTDREWFRLSQHRREAIERRHLKVSNSSGPVLSEEQGRNNQQEG